MFWVERQEQDRLGRLECPLREGVEQDSAEPAPGTGSGLQIETMGNPVGAGSSRETSMSEQAGGTRLRRPTKGQSMAVTQLWPHCALH